MRIKVRGDLSVSVCALGLITVALVVVEIWGEVSPPGLGFGRVSPTPRPESDRDFFYPVVFRQKGSVLLPDPDRVRSLESQLSVGPV
jgi:hypothetical protein